MTLNPELRRYLWLELSPGRLVLMPVVLGLVLFLIAAWTFDGSKPGGGDDFLGTLAGTASAGYALLVLFLGARAAAGAMVREIAERTWDQQRLSSIGAWSMTWGKLFGSTVFIWYCCLILLAIKMIALGLWETHYGTVSEETGQPLLVTLLQIAMGLVAFTVLVEASVILIAMTSVSRRESARQLDVTIAQIVVLVSAFVIVGLFDELESGQRIYWFSYAFNAYWFGVISAVLFAGWAVIGLWRRMRVELQMKSRPVLWPLFVLFTGLWMAGLTLGETEAFALTFTVLIMTVTAMVTTYIQAVLERMDPVHLRRLFGTLREGRFGVTLTQAPLWVVSHLMALVGVLASVLLLLLTDPGAALDDAEALLAVDVPGLAAGTLIAWYLFITRDLMLLVFFWLGRNTRRAFTTWLVWMVLLYGLAPMIVASVEVFTILPAFVPFWDLPFVEQIVPAMIWPALEVLAVAALLRWRWRHYAASAVEKTAAG
jgi:hypothetical protein